MLTSNDSADGGDVPLDLTYQLILYVVGLPLGLIIIAGNAVFLAALIYCRALDTKTHKIISHLCAWDIIAGLLLVIHVATIHEQALWAASSTTWCQVWASLQLLPIVAGFLFLTFVHIERLISVAYTVHYGPVFKAKRVHLYSAILSIYSIIIGGLVFAFPWRPSVGHHGLCDVIIIPKAYLLFLLIHTIFCCVISVIIRVRINHILRLHQRKIQVTNTLTYNNLCVDTTSAQVFFVTLLVISVLWFAFFVCVIVSFVGVENRGMTIALRATHLVSYLASLKYCSYLIQGQIYRQSCTQIICCVKRDDEPRRRQLSRANLQHSEA